MELKDLTCRPPLKKINHTAMVCALGCQRKFLYRYRWGLRPKAKPIRPNLDVGTLGHRILSLGDEGPCIVREEVTLEQMKIQAIIEQGGDLVGNLAASITEMSRAYEKAYAIVELWRNRFPPHDKIRDIGREVVVECLLPNCDGLTLRAQIDVLVLDGRISYRPATWIRDWKFSGLDLEQIMVGYGWGIQRRCYRLAADSYLQTHGYPPSSGFLLSYIRIPNIRLSNEDRDFRLVKKVFKTGKRKDQEIEQLEYYGEPKHENYMKRITRWYLEQGVQAMQSQAIIHNESPMTSEFGHALDFVRHCCQAEPIPEDFDRDMTRRACQEFRSACCYEPLCGRNMGIWAALVGQDFEITKSLYDDDRDLQETNNENIIT